jgi:anti-sigma factor RsiW
MSSHDDLHMLIGGYLDGHLAPDELAALARRLADDPAAVDTFAELAMTDVLLEQYFHDAGMDATADALFRSQRSKLQSLALAESDQPCAEGVCPDARRTWAGRPSLGFRFVLAASVLFVIVGLSVVVPRWIARLPDAGSSVVADLQHDSSLATVERTMLVPTTGSHPVTAGRRIYPGQSIRIDSGLVEVSVDAGASLILKGPADLQFLSPLRAILHRGTVTAKVAESAHGFPQRPSRGPRHRVRRVGVRRRRDRRRRVRRQGQYARADREPLIRRRVLGRHALGQQPAVAIRRGPARQAGRRHAPARGHRQLAVPHLGVRRRRYHPSVFADPERQRQPPGG